MNTLEDHKRPGPGDDIALLRDFGFAHLLQSYANAIDWARMTANARGPEQAAELRAWADAMEARRTEIMRTGNIGAEQGGNSDG